MASVYNIPNNVLLREQLQDRALKFLKGKIKDHKGRSISYYTDEMNEKEMEESHDWIQWAFPIDSFSPHNTHAGNLFFNCQPHFKTNGIANKNVMVMLDKYMNSIGISLDYSFPQIDANKFFSVVDSPFNHHHKRISRVLRHSIVTGYSYRAQSIVEAITDELILPAHTNFSTNTVAYWNKIAYHDRHGYTYF